MPWIAAAARWARGEGSRSVDLQAEPAIKIDSDESASNIPSPPRRFAVTGRCQESVSLQLARLY